MLAMQEGSMNLDFVILPAPVLIPEAAYKRSYAISRRYLQNTKDTPTLSVCVVKATSDLNNSLALKHVIDVGQLRNTFLVLSKSEEVTESSQDEHVVNTLLKISRDSQLLHELPACVATADYTSKYYSLDTAEEEEHRVFHKYVQDLVSFAGDDQDVAAGFNGLWCMLSNEALVVKLARKMQDYAVQHWRPKSQQLLTPIMRGIKHKFRQVDEPVAFLTPQSVLKEVNNQVTSSMLANFVTASAWQHC